jgi:hypothetical protein
MMPNELVSGDTAAASAPGASTNSEWMQQFVENQKGELALRAQELELNKQKDNNSFAFARDALKAQSEDRVHDRDCARKTRRDVLWLILAAVVVVASVVVVALWRDKEQVAMEIIKDAMLFLTGGAGGYGISQARKRDDSPPAQTQVE